MEEVALGMFDGVCYLCQKKGLKAHFCPTKWVNGGNNSSENTNKKVRYID